ncbi:Baculoviral IAP repeat-containing protein 5 [Cichlidogyrus casuarinus]|uniref:Baculoviral IAP repeat-containing protein 5 n=1 Tax=Cichlidogyrus casuarinus TaxID=1844966 RepID=A0ABD2PTN4_9PLAT
MTSERKATFMEWPHPDSAACNVDSLSSAGFVKIPSTFDSVRCVFCRKELEGFDAEDDPFKEHSSHCPNCPFVIAQFPELENFPMNKLSDFLSDICTFQLNAYCAERTTTIKSLIKDVDKKIAEIERDMKKKHK